MAVVDPQFIVDIIRTKFPQAQVEVLNRGNAPAPNFSAVRYTIRTHLFGSLVQFNFGENLIALLDNEVVDALKNVPLLSPASIKKAVDYWLNDIQNYLKHHELPIVKHLARKYFGAEINAERKSRNLYVFYDVFFIAIPPTQLFFF